VIEVINSAYDLFLGKKKRFSIPRDFEINTNASLRPERIQNYLKNIKDIQVQSEILEIVFHYLIFIHGKYLQMLVAYHIGKSDPESVTYEIIKFNGNHQKLLPVFSEVTGYELVLGRIPDPKVVKIKPEVLNQLELLNNQMGNQNELMVAIKQIQMKIEDPLNNDHNAAIQKELQAQYIY
jgi:hypothetical protein